MPILAAPAFVIFLLFFSCISPFSSCTPTKIFSRPMNFPGHVWRKGVEARNGGTPILVLTVPSAEHRRFSPPFPARRHVTFAVAVVFKTREHKREISGGCPEKERIQGDDMVEKCSFFMQLHTHRCTAPY